MLCGYMVSLLSYECLRSPHTEFLTLAQSDCQFIAMVQVRSAADMIAVDVFHVLAAGLAMCILGEALIELNRRTIHAVGCCVVHCALAVDVGSEERVAARIDVVGVNGLYG